MKKKCLIICLIMLLIIPFFASIGSAQISPNDYAPIFYFEAEETCYPVDAQYQIDSSTLKSTDILGLTDLEYYDNDYGGVNDNGVIEHYQSVMNNYGYVVYYNLDTSGSDTVLQYWMFYAFNKGDLNQHEGDWEMVQIVFDSNDQPSWVGYSQHHSGQKATWSQVEKNDNNIKVYVARGSHANYLRSYSGKLGIASDIVGANGKVLTTNDYTLRNIESESWKDFEGRWGWLPDETSDAAASQILGQNGPEGPQYRVTWTGVSLWDDPAAWGNSLMEANDMFFMGEWFVYNFVMIFLLVTLAIVGLMAFRIYRRHKKYGLGPRFLSLLYIDGLNLHSIGNILCIVAIVIAFIGLISPWYSVSYDVTGSGLVQFETEGLVDIFSFDGVSGLHITIPGTSGPVPMGSFDFPISLFLAVGLILMIISTIGISLSRKLGFKYMFRGVRLFSPLILIFIFVIALGSIVPSLAGGDTVSGYIGDIMNGITGSPLGGQSTTTLPQVGITAQVNVQWGIGLGIWLLIIAAIIFIVAGILMMMSKKQFFITKVPLPGKPMPMPAGHQHPMVSPPVQQPPKQAKEKPTKQEKSKDSFCHECGTKLEKDATFCVKCGKKSGK